MDQTYEILKFPISQTPAQTDHDRPINSKIIKVLCLILMHNNAKFGENQIKTTVCNTYTRTHTRIHINAYINIASQIRYQVGLKHKEKSPTTFQKYERA